MTTRAAARLDGQRALLAGGSWRCSGACAEHDRLEFADIDAELEGGGAGEGVDLAADEPLLDGSRFRVCPLGGVLHCCQRDGAQGAIDGSVVIAVRINRRRGEPLEGPLTTHGRADASDGVRGCASAGGALEHRGGPGDPGESQPFVIDLVNDAEALFGRGLQPVDRRMLRCQVIPDPSEQGCWVSARANSGQDPLDVIHASVGALGRQPGEHLANGFGS